MRHSVILVIGLLMLTALGSATYKRLSWGPASAGSEASPASDHRTTAGRHTAAPSAPASRVLDSRVGMATFYGRGFDGRMTASGERFDNDALVAAHPTYPFGTIVRVTNLGNQKTVRVRVLDRGPARGSRSTGVVIDLSRAAAGQLDFLQSGRTRVRLDVLEWGDSSPDDTASR